MSALSRVTRVSATAPASPPERFPLLLPAPGGSTQPFARGVHNGYGTPSRTHAHHRPGCAAEDPARWRGWYPSRVAFGSGVDVINEYVEFGQGFPRDQRGRVGAYCTLPHWRRQSH